MNNLDKKAIFDDRSQIKATRRINAIIGDHHPAVALHINRIKELASTPITLSVMGEFSAGKSTFINQLLGNDVLPVSILPKTATITRVMYGETPRIEIEYRHQNERVIREEGGYEGLRRLQNAKKISDDDFKRELEGIHEVRVFVDNPLLKKFTLVDTPGFNHDAAMDGKTMAALPNTDLIVWLSDYTQLAKRTEFDVIEQLREQNQRIYLVINKADVHVSCTESYHKTMMDVEWQLNENGFLKLFCSKEFYLISCKRELAFWDGMFQQFLSRFGRAVLDEDIAITIGLISSQWEKLKQAIFHELSQHKIMRSKLQHVREHCNVETILAEHTSYALSYFDNNIREISEELINHGDRATKLCTANIPAANRLVWELLMMDLYERVTAMEAAYAKIISEIYLKFTDRLCHALTDLADSINDQHNEELQMLRLIIAHYDLNRDCLGDVPVIPRATTQATEIIDGIYYLLRKKMNNVDIEIHQKLSHALKRDLENDLRDIVLDRSLALVLTRLEQGLSEGMFRLSNSLELMEA